MPTPTPSNPGHPPCGIASRLPHHVLVAVFAAARDLDVSLWDHGGELEGWDSNESIAPLALVSRSWSDAASSLLYRSVAILGGTAADLFLRTLRTRPERALFIRELVVGRDEDAEEAGSTAGMTEESAKLVEVLEACPDVQTLHVRPLHSSARESLLSAITSRRWLKTLVCLPGQNLPGGTLFEPGDILTLATPTIEILELDFSTSPAPLPSPLPILPPLALTHLHAYCSGATDALFHLISHSGHTLLSLDLYFEAAIDPLPTSSALLPCAPTLRDLTYLTNAPASDFAQPNPLEPPLFDLLLPRFAALEHLGVAATDISPAALRTLPPSLRRLEVHSLGCFSWFSSAEEVVAVLEADGVVVGLEAFALFGEEWGAAEVERVREAFRRRGVGFRFAVD